MKADENFTPRSTRFIAGDLANDAHSLDKGGWVVGIFFNEDPSQRARTSKEVEVKYWSFQKGSGNTHRLKTSATVEWTYIIEGEVRAIVDDEVFTLCAGEYVVIQPDTPNNLVAEVIQDTRGLTIKAPSNPAAKTVLD